MRPEDKAVWEKVVELLEDNREYIEANERPEYLALYDKGIDDANALLEQPEPEPVQEPKSSERVQWIFEDRWGEQYTPKNERYTKREAEITARLLGHKSIGPAWLNQDTEPAQPAPVQDPDCDRSACGDFSPGPCDNPGCPALRANPHAQPAPVRHPRWYCIDKNGAAILCADEDDARQNAKLAEQDWPRNAPYRAVQLCAVYDAEAANGITAAPEKGGAS